jgi:hypothetical protein
MHGKPPRRAGLDDHPVALDSPDGPERRHVGDDAVRDLRAAERRVALALRGELAAPLCGSTGSSWPLRRRTPAAGLPPACGARCARSRQSALCASPRRSGAHHPAAVAVCASSLACLVASVGSCHLIRLVASGPSGRPHRVWPAHDTRSRSAMSALGPNQIVAEGRIGGATGLGVEDGLLEQRRLDVASPALEMAAKPKQQWSTPPTRSLSGVRIWVSSL